MSPQDPARMYVCANWMVGYPYGVPAVEENEKMQTNAAAQRCSTQNCGTCFGC